MKNKMTDEQWAEFEQKHPHHFTAAWQKWKHCVDLMEQGLSLDEVAKKTRMSLNKVKLYTEMKEP